LAQRETEDRPTRARIVPRLAFGVAITAAAIIGGYFVFKPQVPPDTFATRKGEQKHLVLQDGSEVTLNYATDLVIQRMQPNKPRLLSLTGEAHFLVRRNETPFIVSTNCAEVQVVGTEFNLRARDGMLEVAVIHGIVKVSAKDSTLTLSQNQRAFCALNSFPKRIGDMPSPEYPGWIQGKLFFDRTSFEAACREIEMRFDIAIRIDDANVRNEIVTGMLNAKNAESALIALCGLTGKRFRNDGHAYTIY
jgi:ferric-dicitrate binding protein FerR (iron transport regulator)